jgi:hypothetical protein
MLTIQTCAGFTLTLVSIHLLPLACRRHRLAGGAGHPGTWSRGRHLGHAGAPPPAGVPAARRRPALNSTFAFENNTLVSTQTQMAGF